jgi:hypothetical protein
MLAARTLKEWGGRLVRLHPQRPVAKALGLLVGPDVHGRRGDPG